MSRLDLEFIPWQFVISNQKSTTINSIRVILLLGTVAIIGLLVFQGFWLLRSWDLKEQEFHYNVSKVLHQVAENIAEYNQIELPKSDLIKQRSSNYYSVNVNSAIDANILEDYLVRGFTEASIKTDFEYAVYDCSNDEYQYSNYCNLTEQQDKELTNETLPKFNDLIYYFIVKFPSRSSLLINDLRTPILFSLLTILSVLSFMYAIWVILRQKQVTDLQTDFINNMTHEFKTPISSIKIASDYLLQNDKIRSDTRLTKYADVIKEQNKRLNNQVEKVLNLARLEKDQFKLKKEEIDLVEFSKTIVNQEKIKFENCKGSLNLDIPSNPIYINADLLHLTNVLSNILDNALKYCETTPLVLMTIKDISLKECSITIKDNGIGIPKDDLKKVFNKFYRISTGDIHNVKGFGLGLFYVKNICVAHNWHINFESTLNEGTTVEIKIPRINK